MNRVTKRTWIMGLFVFVLLGGMVLFVWEYAVNANRWVAFSGSPHVYNGTNIGCGTITDRAGNILLDITDNRAYSKDLTTRQSTLHWLGDRKGYIKAGAISNYAAEMSGFDLVNGIYDTEGTGGEGILTLFSSVQNAAYEAMAGRKGTVAVYNYKTGEILCAVSTPSFDPDNEPDIEADTTGKYEGVYINRFLQSSYVPGSIFKLVTTAAALECVPDILDMRFSCTGKLKYGTEAVTCEGVHGNQTLRQALANSCNCAFAQVAELVGRKNMEAYVEKFGVVDSISFDGVQTVEGNYDLSESGVVSFAWSCIGQHTDLINPCRYMTFMGAIAGDGVGAKPYLVQQVKAGEKLTYQAQTQKMERIMSEETAQTLREYMRNNVQSVYGAWNFPGMTVCAKSGTSQLGGGQTSNAMFAGFVEEEEYPLAFIVVVENGGYGSATCVPILRQVLDACRVALDSQ